MGFERICYLELCFSQMTVFPKTACSPNKCVAENTVVFLLLKYQARVARNSNNNFDFNNVSFFI